jgi:uncharacterized protein YdaU (DUF1376 family)
MSSSPWFRWFPADYRRKTMHLSFVEDSAYRRLIEAYMECKGPLPCDPAALYRLCGAQDSIERTAIDRIAGEFFQNGDGRLRHKRCDKELANQKTQATMRSASASHASRIRWASGTVSGKMRDSDSDSDSSSNTKSEKSKTKPARRRATPLPPDFRISEKVKSWSIEKGHQNLEAHLEAFIRNARAKDYRYADWDAAFMNAIAGDWGKVSTPAGRSLQERRVANMDDLTGRNRNGRTANPVDGTIICAPVGYLRQPDDDDVG